MNKKLLETTVDEEEAKTAQEEVSENLEKTKQLMTYAQKNQQAKESYKPGADWLSSGRRKLLITIIFFYCFHVKVRLRKV